VEDNLNANTDMATNEMDRHMHGRLQAAARDLRVRTCDVYVRTCCTVRTGLGFLRTWCIRTYGHTYVCAFMGIVTCAYVRTRRARCTVHMVFESLVRTYVRTHVGGTATHVPLSVRCSRGDLRRLPRSRSWFLSSQSRWRRSRMRSRTWGRPTRALRQRRGITSGRRRAAPASRHSVRTGGDVSHTTLRCTRVRTYVSDNTACCLAADVHPPWRDLVGPRRGRERLSLRGRQGNPGDRDTRSHGPVRLRTYVRWGVCMCTVPCAGVHGG
jgi:hypothetical protein